MKKIIGHIRVKESDHGIPNLVVQVIDTDREMKDIEAEYQKNNGFPSQFIEKLGKSLGSVLTDNEGKFIFPTEDLEFAGNETRPDLIIVVFAPEDAQDIEQNVKPFSLSHERRILYISRVPRMNAGAEEAYRIRLLQKQLDKFHIPVVVNSTDKSEFESNELANSILNSWKFRDNLKDRLKEKVNIEYQKAKERKDEARKQVENLSAIPHAQRDYEFLIKDKRELKENLKNIQSTAINKGLENLEKSSHKPTLRLLLTQEEFNNMGLKEIEGEIKGKIKVDKLNEKIASFELDLVKKSKSNNISLEDLLKKYVIPNQKVKNENDKPIG